MEEERVQVGFTVDSDVKILLEKLAISENRSMANYIEVLIRREAKANGITVTGSLKSNFRLKQL